MRTLQALPTSATIGYIKIDAKPIKQALSTWVTKWIYLYTHYLQNKVGVQANMVPGQVQVVKLTLQCPRRLASGSLPLLWHHKEPIVASLRQAGCLQTRPLLARLSVNPIAALWGGPMTCATQLHFCPLLHALVQVSSSMEELHRFMAQSNATMDLKVGSEAAAEVAESGEAAAEEDTPAAKQAKAEETRRALFAIMSCMRDMRKRSDRTGGLRAMLQGLVGCAVPQKGLRQVCSAHPCGLRAQHAKEAARSEMSSGHCSRDP